MPDQKQKSLFPEIHDPSKAEGLKGLENTVTSAKRLNETCRTLQASIADFNRVIGTTRRMASASQNIMAGMATLVTGPWAVSRGMDRWQKKIQLMRECAMAGPLRDAVNLHSDFLEAVERQLPGRADGDEVRDGEENPDG